MICRSSAALIMLTLIILRSGPLPLLLLLIYLLFPSQPNHLQHFSFYSLENSEPQTRT